MDDNKKAGDYSPAFFMLLLSFTLSQAFSRSHAKYLRLVHSLQTDKPIARCAKNIPDLAAHHPAKSPVSHATADRRTFLGSAGAFCPRREQATLGSLWNTVFCGSSPDSQTGRELHFDHRQGNRKIQYPDVAELVPRHIWDVEIAHSNRVIRIKKPLESSDFRGFFFVYCGARFEPLSQKRFTSNISLFKFRKSIKTRLMLHFNLYYIFIDKLYSFTTCSTCFINFYALINTIYCIYRGKMVYFSYFKQAKLYW